MKAGLIGDRIGGSLTPLMHETEGQALGIAYSYVRIDTAEAPHAVKPLSALIEAAEADGFAGLNITHPFKVDAVSLADELSGIARDLGAINTLVLRDGRRVGHNTDYAGFRAALARDLPDQAFEKVALFGAGGAGLAVALALIDHGASELCVVDTEPQKADALARQMKTVRPDARVTAGPVDLALLDGAVNATPLGMAGYPGMAFDPARLSPDAWVADIVYFPLNTPLLAAARGQGRRVMSGAGMALFQAVAAFELITGQRPDPGRMQATLEAALQRMADAGR